MLEIIKLLTLTSPFIPASAAYSATRQICNIEFLFYRAVLRYLPCLTMRHSRHCSDRHPFYFLQTGPQTALTRESESAAVFVTTHSLRRTSSSDITRAKLKPRRPSVCVLVCMCACVEQIHTGTTPPCSAVTAGAWED